MPRCSNCLQDLPRSDFSSRQLKKKTNVCKDCMVGGDVGDPKHCADPEHEPVTAISTDEGLAEELYNAAAADNSDLVKRLLHAKAPIDEGVTDKQHTAMHVSSEKGHIRVVKLLVDSRATIDLHAMDEYETTALWKASKYGHQGIVTLLLAAMASTEVEINDGGTSLHIAAESGHVSIAHLLISWRASIAHRDCDDMSPLSYACLGNHSKVAAMLLRCKAPVNFEEGRRSPLFIACDFGSVACVRLLINARARIDCEDSTICPCGCFGGPEAHGKRTPLTSACFYGHVEILTLLLATEIVQRNRSNARIALNLCQKLGREQKNGSYAKCEQLLRGQLHQCAYCARQLASRAQKCSKCELAYYCCAEHQKLHWPSHKVECDKLRSLVEAEKSAGAKFTEQCSKIRAAPTVLYAVVPTGTWDQLECTGIYQRHYEEGHLKPVWKHTELNLWLFQSRAGFWFINDDDNDDMTIDFDTEEGFIRSATDDSLVPHEIKDWERFDCDEDEFIHDRKIVITADLGSAQDAAALLVGECRKTRNVPSTLHVNVPAMKMIPKSAAAPEQRREHAVSEAVYLPCFCTGIYNLTSHEHLAFLVWKHSQRDLWLFKSSDGHWYIDDLKDDEEASEAAYDDCQGYVRSSACSLSPLSSERPWEFFNIATGKFVPTRKITISGPPSPTCMAVTPFEQTNSSLHNFISACDAFCNAESAASSIAELAYEVAMDSTETIANKLIVASTLYVYVPSRVGSLQKCTGMYELLQLSSSPAWKHLSRQRWIFQDADGIWLISNNKDLNSVSRCYVRSRVANELPYNLLGCWESYDQVSNDFVHDENLQVSDQPLLAAAAVHRKRT